MLMKQNVNNNVGKDSLVVSTKILAESSLMLNRKTTRLRQTIFRVGRAGKTEALLARIF